MQWIECTVNLSPETIEPVGAMLDDIGIAGYLIEDERDFLDFLEHNRAYWDIVDEGLSQAMKGVSRIKFYLADDETGRATLTRVKKALAALPHALPQFHWDNLTLCEQPRADEDWNETWKQFYKPFAVGEHLIVKPEWEPLPAQLTPPGRRVMSINPGMSFGTGTHESTRMCLGLIERFLRSGDSMLDLGCGSGILSVAALILGAGYAAGVDIDPIARDSARENARLNDIADTDYDLFTGDVLADQALIETLSAREYDLIAANIVADVIVALADKIPQLIRDGGIFLCSGILHEYAGKVEEKFTACGFELLCHEVDGAWSAYAVRIRR